MRADRAAQVSCRNPLTAADHDVVGKLFDRIDGQREGVREAALKTPQSRDLSPQARAVDAGHRDLEIIQRRAGRKRAGKRRRLRAADGGAIARNE